jgi:hypothetical protein
VAKRRPRESEGLKEQYLRIQAKRVDVEEGVI